MSLLSFSDVKELAFPEAKTPQIRVESWSNAARILQIRGFTRDGTLSFDHTTNGDRSIATSTFNVSDIPAVMQVSPAVAPVRRGECYVRVTLLMAGFAVGRLIAGYVTDGMTLAWPGGKFENFTDGAGLLRTITGTNPAAGAEISETVPTNTRWKLRSVIFALSTDATVASRQVKMRIDDGASRLYEVVADQDQVASENRTYYVIPGMGYTPRAYADFFVGYPADVVLLQGFRLVTATANLKAADDFGSPTMYIEEWIEE